MQVSTGTKAVFLSPTDALHGDIGIVGEADLLVAFSKSGGSEELLKLLPFAKVPADAGEGIMEHRSSRAHLLGPAL
jgi:arabinose-5-phosphate isomerase